MTVSELRRLTDDRYELSLETGERMKISLNQVADFSLYSGRVLSEEELDSLREAASFNRTKERAMRIISARAMSERELYDRLLEKGETEHHAAAAVAWLLELHFLNDADYASGLVRRYAAKGYGPRRIRDELYRHKLPRELWDDALSELPEQDDAIDHLLRSRLRNSDPEDAAARRRAADALLRRGFSYEEIRGAFERYDSESI